MSFETKETLDKALRDKLLLLKDNISKLDSLAVGFSGGTDSTLLLYAAHEVLGDRALGVTCTAAAMPERELEEAKSFCTERGIRQVLCSVDPLQLEEFRNNHPDRCYHCKKLIFGEIKRIAAENGMSCVADGTNTDDLRDYRPGQRAVSELEIISPLREAGLGKDEIRQLSRAFGLPNWNKPACACLASRFVYGEEITVEKLGMLDRAEEFLLEQGFSRVRVRLHDRLARIELPPEEIGRLIEADMRNRVYDRLKELGLMYVTVDLFGYRMGSMNSVLREAGAAG